MEKSSAIRIIRQTFQNPFNKDSFVYFVKNLLNHINPASFIYRDDSIPDAYKPYVKTLERIGKYQDKDGKKIDLLIVHLKKETSLEYARTRQRNFIAWYLNGSRDNILKDAALVAFVSPSSEDWRFSLVKMDYRLDTSGKKVKVKQELTSAKRFSFLVGQNESSHTAQSQLLPILQNDNRNPTLQDLEEAFSVEGVTKEFFKKLSDWYAWAIDNVQFPKDAEKEKKDQQGRKIALIRFLTRIIFIWFMKQKKLSSDSQKSLIPDYLSDENKLKDILRDFNPQGEESTYYKAILQNLFFATLSTRKEDRRLAKDSIWFGQKKVKSEMDVNNVYRYKELFKRQDEEYIKGLFNDIPFLNGGLFECLDKRRKDIYIDGFTRRDKKGYYQPIFPNFLFFSPERRNDEQINKSLNKYYGTKNRRYQVEGLINILKRYNFTIDENSPVDIDIALDPELLGRIFENLLASYNPETATTARKATGSYYTPREIVHYMVDESLKAYFKTKLGDIRDIDQKLKELFSYETDKNSFNEEETRKLVKAIDEIRVIDPAVGSGAFPMGILQRLVFLLSKLDPDNKIWRERQIVAIEENVNDEVLRAELIKEIKNNFTKNKLDYGRKLYLIKNCIYGVDIQTIAIQITKLRFFISLLVDMKVDKSKDNFGIKPLPNLDFKFVAANSLVSPPETEQRDSLFQDKFFSNLQRDIEEYFYLSNYEEKDKARNKIERLIQKRIKREESDITRNYTIRGHAANGKKIVGRKEREIKEANKLIKLWDSYKNIFSHSDPVGFFEIKYFFPNIKNGFDIVIANPPYVRQEKIREQKPKLKEARYEVFDSRADLYTYFYEKSFDLLKKGGVLCFISSNKWLRAKYGEKLRRFLKNKTTILEIIDFGGYKVFKATVDTNIILFRKKEPSKNHKLKFVNLKSEIDGSLIEYIKNNQKELLQEKLNNNAWTLADEKVLALKEKIEKIGKPLKDWDVKIYFGIKTGFNEAFIINAETRNRILANCKTEEGRRRTEDVLKPILRGRDIGRYYYKWAGLWVIEIESGWTDKNRGKENPEEFFQRIYPAIYNYLISFKNFKAKGKGLFDRDDQGDYWWELRDCSYYPEFEKEKIVWQEIVREPSFALDNRNFYCEATTFLMTGKNLKHLIAILNSKPATFFFKQFYAGGGLGEEGYRYKKVFLEQLPIPSITQKNQHIAKEVESFVNKILAITREEDYLENPIKQAEVRECEKQIDQLVYKLYNLTPEEIKIVESYG